MVWRALAHVHRLMMVVAIMVLGVWVMDHLTTAVPEPAPLPDPPPSGGREVASHRGQPRAFVLLVDSLRFQTATDPGAMPHLAAMRERGVHAKLISSRDAVTVSAIREMFTGRERFMAFGFVRDFVTGRESIESLFTQTKHAAIPTSVYPPYAFVQFAGDFPLEPVDDDAEDRDQALQNRWVRQALERFVSGEKQFVVSHIVYSDRVAHDHGIHGQTYRDTFLGVDQLIAEIDARIAQSDTLVITGDHGHTDNGRHSLGLDVPSFMVYRGDAFARGLDLGTVPITAHRYFLSWALGLPLIGDYASTRHPEALASRGDVPRAYTSPGQTGRTVGPAADAWAFMMLALDAGLLAGAWLALWWMKKSRRHLIAAHWLALICLGLVVFDMRALWVPPLAIAAGIAAAWRSGEERAALHRATRWAAVGAALGVAAHGWGRILAAQRDWLHEPSFSELELAAAAVVCATAALAWRIGAVRASWIAVGVIGALGYPTVYRYGAMPALVTMWLAWLAATLVDGRRATMSHRRIALLMAPAIFLFVQPFAFADAGNFQHVAWRPWIERLVPHGHEQWMWAALVAKLVVLARWNVPHRCKPLGVFAAWQLHEIHWTQWYPSDLQYVFMIAALAIAGGALPRWLDEPSGRETRRVCWLWAMYLAYYYTIRLPNDHYMWCDCFLAALVLSAAVARRCSTPDALRGHEAILGMLALVVAGWVTVAWTLHLYEWKVLYNWFPAAVVEEHALWFIPFINGRYVLPVVMARVLLRDGLRDVQPYPRQELWAAVGVKMVALTCLVSGIGLAVSDSEVYLEAIGQTAIVMVLSVGLL